MAGPKSNPESLLTESITLDSNNKSTLVTHQARDEIDKTSPKIVLATLNPTVV